MPSEFCPQHCTMMVFKARECASGIALIAIVLLTVRARQATSAPQPKEVSTNVFSMVVKVVDVVSGQPLENSVVTVPQWVPPPGEPTTWRFVTDASGSFGTVWLRP